MAEMAAQVPGLEREGRLRKGRTYTTSQIFTQAVQEEYIRFSWDTNPIHLGDDAIVHGMALLVWGATVAGTQFPGNGAIARRLDKVRWLKPVYVGDRVTLSFTVKGVRRNREGQIVKIRVQFLVEDRREPKDRLVCSAEFMVAVPS